MFSIQNSWRKSSQPCSCKVIEGITVNITVKMAIDPLCKFTWKIWFVASHSISMYHFLLHLTFVHFYAVLYLGNLSSLLSEMHIFGIHFFLLSIQEMDERKNKKYGRIVASVTAIMLHSPRLVGSFPPIHRYLNSSLMMKLYNNLFLVTARLV